MSAAPALAPMPRVHLVGNPNAGKTTLFNALAGTRARTGNYPGVTVERRAATWKLGERSQHAEIELVDLPGTYSLSARSPEGRRAFLAYRTQRQISLASEGKLAVLEGLLRQHARDRVLIFTNDNDTVYTISRTFLIPALTHQTDLKERREHLARFNDGQYPALVTSRVLNEGVNIPAANVAIVLSGTASVREHVQRLGRVLRRQEGKRATLYEVITRGTAEERQSDRRRDHDAYR